MKHLSKEVSFPIAKLLQEKEISIRSKFFYTENFGLCSLSEDGEFLYIYCHPETNKFEVFYDCNGTFEEGVRYFAPTVGEVVDWIYENHEVWINVNITRYGKFYCNIILKEKCKDLKNPFTWEFMNQLNDFNSPTEAYESAFEYFLNNLIEKP